MRTVDVIHKMKLFNRQLNKNHSSFCRKTRVISGGNLARKHSYLVHELDDVFHRQRSSHPVDAEYLQLLQDEMRAILTRLDGFRDKTGMRTDKKKAFNVLLDTLKDVYRQLEEEYTK